MSSEVSFPRPGTTSTDVGKLHTLSEANLIRFAKKQVANLYLLCLETKNKSIPSNWLPRFIETAQDHELLMVFEYIRTEPEVCASIKHELCKMLDCVRMRRTSPNLLDPVLIELGKKLSPEKHFDIYIRLVALHSRSQARATTLPAHPLQEKLRKFALNTLDNHIQLGFIQCCLDSNWNWPAHHLLLTAQGQLALRGVVYADSAAALMHDKRIRKGLNLTALIDLAKALNNPDILRIYYAEISCRITLTSLNEITAELVQHNVWLGWRRNLSIPFKHSKLPRLIALAWLQNSTFEVRGNKIYAQGLLHTADQPQPAGGAEKIYIMPSMQTWRQVMDDINQSGGLDCTQMQQLCTNGPPWIPFQEFNQLATLARAACDLGALAQLCETVSYLATTTHNGEPLHRFLLRHCKLHNRFENSPDILLWLVAPSTQDLAPLNMQTSLALFECASCRKEIALKAVALALLHASMRTPSNCDLKIAQYIEKWRNSHADSAQALIAIIQEDLQARQAQFEHQLSLPCKILFAILAGDAAARCWQQLEQLLEESCLVHTLPHVNQEQATSPMAQIGATISESLGVILDYKQFADGLWRIFDTEDTHPSYHTLQRLVSPSGLFPKQVTALPIFQFLTAALPNMTVGIIALHLINANVCRHANRQSSWWIELLHGLHNSRRSNGCNSADDRTDVALTLILSQLQNYAPDTTQALRSALEQYKAHWPLLKEFEG